MTFSTRILIFENVGFFYSPASGTYLREVYHTEDKNRLALKEVVGLYHDRVRAKVRQINKLRGYCRSYGITVPADALQHLLGWNMWLRQLGVPSLVKQLSIMRIGLDAVIKQVRMAKKEVAGPLAHKSLLCHYY